MKGATILEATANKFCTSGMADTIEDFAQKGKYGKDVTLQREDPETGKKVFYFDDILRVIQNDIANEIKLIITSVADGSFHDSEERELLNQTQTDTIGYFLDELKKCKENPEEVPAILFLETSSIMNDLYSEKVTELLTQKGIKGNMVTMETDNPLIEENIKDLLAAA